MESIRRVVHAVEGHFELSLGSAQIYGKMRRKKKKSTMLDGSQKLLTLILFKATVAHPKIDNSHQHVDSLSQKYCDRFYDSHAAVEHKR